MAAEATKPPDPTPPPPPLPITDPNTSRTLLKSFAAVCKGQQQNTDIQTREPTTYQNKPVVVFTEDEVSTLSTPYQYALVGKMRRNPELKLIKDGLLKLGLAAPFTVGSLHPGFVLINLGSEEDFNRMWTKQEWFIARTTLCLFKWTPDFSIEKESSIAPVWVGFPHLPIHLFSKGALYSLASAIGTPLKLDEPTAVRKRPSVARVCVEIDLRKNLGDSIWIKNGASWFLQKVVIQDRPAYCDVCWRKGHTKESCKGKDFEKKNKEKMNLQKVGTGKESVVNKQGVVLEKNSNVEVAGRNQDTLVINKPQADPTPSIGNKGKEKVSELTLIDNNREGEVVVQGNVDMVVGGKGAESVSKGVEACINGTGSVNRSAPEKENNLGTSSGPSKTNVSGTSREGLESLNKFDPLSEDFIQEIQQMFQNQENSILKDLPASPTCGDDHESSSESIEDTQDIVLENRTRGRPRGKRNRLKSDLNSVVKRTTMSTSDPPSSCQ